MIQVSVQSLVILVLVCLLIGVLLGVRSSRL